MFYNITLRDNHIKIQNYYGYIVSIRYCSVNPVSILTSSKQYVLHFIQPYSTCFGAVFVVCCSSPGFTDATGCY